jgi:hypothetical protein
MEDAKLLETFIALARPGMRASRFDDASWDIFNKVATRHLREDLIPKAVAMMRAHPDCVKYAKT